MPSHRMSFFQLLWELRKRQICPAVVVFGGLWMLIQRKATVHYLCSIQSSEWAARLWVYRGKVNMGCTLPRITSIKWISLFHVRYLQSFSTINSGMQECKQLAVTQKYLRVTAKKLDMMRILTVFCDLEKGISMWDARSIRLQIFSRLKMLPFMKPSRSHIMTLHLVS